MLIPKILSLYIHLSQSMFTYFAIQFISVCSAKDVCVTSLLILSSSVEYHSYVHLIYFSWRHSWIIIETFFVVNYKLLICPVAITCIYLVCDKFIGKPSHLLNLQTYKNMFTTKRGAIYGWLFWKNENCIVRNKDLQITTKVLSKKWDIEI